MNIILWIIFGALVGWIASSLTNTGSGLLADIAIGIVGALIGGWIMTSLGSSGVTGFNLYSFLVATIGAVILILLARAVRRTT